jgi:Zn-dependent peptidase ImmA (M78 family)
VTSRVDLARSALATAARVRLRAGLDAYKSICVYDLAQSMGIDLRFQAVPSLEGMYSPGDPPIIVVSALRPSGRQRVTCAHELGHHVFGHGTRIDELTEASAGPRRFEPEEFLVNCFAEYLLMPKLAVLTALRARGITLEKATPFDLFRVASYFGVGYRTLLHHLEHNLGELSAPYATTLRKTTPQAIRVDVVGSEAVDGELLVADEAWHGRPIDLHVGDVFLLPKGTAVEGGRLAESRENRHGQLYVAAAPGLGRVAHEALQWSSYIRVARRVAGGGFAGRSIYRHEEDDDG